MSKKQEWAVRIKVLVITAVIASIGNMLSTWHAGAPVMPWETIPALASRFVIVILGCLADELMRKIHISLPKILYISLFTMLLSIPGFSPIAEWMQVNYAKIGVLPLCTPILAYAGISIGKAYLPDGFCRHLYWFGDYCRGAVEADSRDLTQRRFLVKTGTDQWACPGFFVVIDEAGKGLEPWLGEIPLL